MNTMKYSNLTQIASFIAKFKKITKIKRIQDNAIFIKFDNDFELIFDLSKDISSIYQNPNLIFQKEYKAPFDTILKKRFTGADIVDIFVPKNNRILVFKTIYSGSYKALKSYLIMEFTGRFTNVIITDENEVILEALRHHENDFRSIKVGKKLLHLEPFLIKEKECEKIENFELFFKSEFENLVDNKFTQIKQIKIAQISKKIENLLTSLNELENADDLLIQSEIYSKNATLILANLSMLNDYDRNINLIDFNGNDVSLNLEESPKDSANSFWNRSKKLKQKAKGIDIERKNLNEKIAFYENLLSLINLAKSAEELEIIYPKAKNVKKVDTMPLDVQNFYIDEFKISVGKNQKGNVSLLKNASKNDFWFHIKDISSAHVIVKTNKKTMSDEVIYLAAQICVNFSTKNAGNYQVDYTKRENVKIIKDSHVNYINYKTIYINKE
ncbi:NFACT RNA binding domain-containing protein [Campylobacter sputorum]|uniref:NFACT RNA binding domain-containing protein n=2 Tax=Campylobacter sputorum TaxID=206 RepID=UPI002B4B9EA8|nr:MULTISPECIES: NFACT RNA binding domain-containing protein [unclassified Campylobacter]